MKIQIILIIVLALSGGCKSDHKKPENKKIEELVRHWHNRKIIIPDSLKILERDENNMSNCLNDTTESKIIAVISGDCQMCFQEIQNWIPFFEKMKKNQIPNRLFFIIEHTNSEYFEKIYACDLPSGFNFFVDESGKFSEINHLPKDKNFKTMLLDKNSKVLLIGSPLASDDMGNLYIEGYKKSN